MTADQIIEGILGKEGGYVDHPSDKGGPTAGASRRPPPVHMAIPVICGTCPGKQQSKFAVANTGPARSSTRWRVVYVTGR
jgi:hypothetical protein